MPQRPKRSRSRGPTKSKRSELDDGLRSIDQLLSGIFYGLAQLLLKQGYGQRRFAQLTKLAFVDAAKSIVGNVASRASIARIATLTGLTRLEVSRLLSVDPMNLLDADDKLNRASRVAIGWSTDDAFLNERRKPKPLPFKMSRGSFSHLVKKYSGDIPARAMLTEMTRLGLVTSTRSGLVSLIRATPSLPRSTFAAIRAISPWVNLVAEGVNSADSNVLVSTAQQKRVHFASISEAKAAARELDLRWNAFAASIQQLATSEKRSGAYEVIVSIALATGRPQRLTQGKS